MMAGHFAVLGTTGVGNSSIVAILQEVWERQRPNVRIFLLDAHNEYDKCFSDKAQVLNPPNLRLPFWLFNFEEMIDVIFGGRPLGLQEVDGNPCRAHSDGQGRVCARPECQSPGCEENRSQGCRVYR